MKISKRILFVLFSVVLSLLVFSNLSKSYAESKEIPVYSNEEEALDHNSEHFIIKNNTANQEKPLLMSGSVGWEEWKLTSTKVLNYNYRFGWHPDFPNRYYYVDHYWFTSSKSTTFSVSISGGYGAFLVSVSSASGSQSGYSLDAISSKKSKPAVYGELLELTYNVKVFNGAGIQTSSRTEKKNDDRNTQAKVDYIQ